MKYNKLVKTLALAMASLGLISNASAEEDRSYILATASTGGTYYPVGVALATLSKVKLAPKQHFSLAAISSAGSGENVKLLNENEAQFAILQGLYGAWAWQGLGPYEKSGRQTQLRSVSMLWQNVEHFIVRSDLAKTGTVSDLENLNGKKFSIGKKNSGTENSGRQIMQGLSVNPEQFKLAFMGYGGSASALQNGTIDGMNTPAGVPVGAVTQAFAALGEDIQILSFTDAQIKQANGDYNIWTKYEIPANTYPGVDKPITTIAQPNFLAVREDISEDDVYQLTKAIYENLPFLQGIHKATKAMALEKGIAGLPVPLHPGAARYYREMGIEIPSELIVN
ncbi:TAXI family TRAP transporter solute-binding subunit [Vibrio sp. 10N.261.51.F11]|jgi:TRAP transporter TAXI family solute receptor|uniref:TAXI family TRAP transporter solute-binding subunit n=1 Tax=Vibrio TaxID=662 RepID=UPI0002E7DA1D|nr:MULTISPECIES: TAXI family TRAP transporter solute-binding subunit [Vibrio]ANP79052.1 C4-dicarboxylate ABC transporter substrate-binding protein [Vibrio crassostreae 9CS106]MCC4889969.1 TAXI family TRAP transporter solute-binding subunit [Vibrio sp. F13]OEF02546.1 C4-dicarboxylate ABC transporter substrate-binding protein [Vibrio crassostreae 9ZC13]PMN98482.1 C4-dicarboxylate ABC transporter substrate-binding protein [Vibrio sp. 10N.222.55.F9]TKG00081.1 TAXI family TRAP transporter solute-bi